MINQQTLRGNWHELTGRLREKWGELSGDELEQFKGNAAQLVGYIQRKTGAVRSEIERFLDEATQHGAAAISHAAEHAHEHVGKAADWVADATDALGERVRDGYETAEGLVRRRPNESVAVAFGAGLMAGVLVALLIRR